MIGKAPIADPSLADNQGAFASVVQALWGSSPEPLRKVGRGRVVTGETVEAALKSVDLAADTTYTRAAPDSVVLFVHRRTTDADIYFVDNRTSRAIQTEASFRVSGKAPELFYPDTGAIAPAGFRIISGRTSVPLSLEPWGTVFVVFRHSTQDSLRPEPKRSETELATVSGPWDIRFEERRGEPETYHLASLASWSDQSDLGVRYFSGHGTYTKHVDAGGDWFKPGSSVMLDLGDVANLAEAPSTASRWARFGSRPFASM